MNIRYMDIPVRVWDGECGLTYSEDASRILNTVVGAALETGHVVTMTTRIVNPVLRDVLGGLRSTNYKKGKPYDVMDIVIVPGDA